ncbi:unnamed protein product, partial [Prorocentrum cordatum]
MSFLLLCWGLLAIRTISLITGTYNPLRANSEDRLGEIVRRTTSFDSVCLVGTKVKEVMAAVSLSKQDIRLVHMLVRTLAARVSWGVVFVIVILFESPYLLIISRD